MGNGFMNEMRFLAGMDPVLDSSDAPAEQLTEEERQALLEAKVSLNSKIHDAQVAFLRNIALLGRKELRKEYPGLDVDPMVTPPMGGGGSIGGVRFGGDFGGSWMIDIVISRKGDKWELWKRGVTTSGRSTPIEIKDKTKVDDIKADFVAMAVAGIYGALMEKAARKAG